MTLGVASRCATVAYGMFTKCTHCARDTAHNYLRPAPPILNDVDERELETVLLLSLLFRRRRNRKAKRGRSMWVRPIFRRRKQQGEYHNLVQEMRLSDPESHFRYLRMSRERFDCLLSEVH